MWACGIECDSISQLSKSAAENKGCVEGAEGRTGTTAKGHLDFLRKHRPPLWQVENVKNLHAKEPSTQKSDLDSLIEQSNALGYYVHAVTMDASAYGLPQSRPRYYLLGVLVPADVILDQMDPDDVQPPWVEKFDEWLMVLQIGHVPWHAVILPNHHEAVILANISPLEDLGEPSTKNGKQLPVRASHWRR